MDGSQEQIASLSIRMSYRGPSAKAPQAFQHGIISNAHFCDDRHGPSGGAGWCDERCALTSIRAIVVGTGVFAARYI
jgi:hypothetical protein